LAEKLGIQLKLEIKDIFLIAIKKNKTKGCWDFFPLIRLCDPLFNDYHECAKGVFSIRIKIGLVYFTTARTFDCGKLLCRIQWMINAYALRIKHFMRKGKSKF